MARRFEGLTRALGGISLASVAYGEIGSSLYFALGVVALYALGLTPLVLLVAGVVFLLVAVSYAEGTAAIPEPGGAALFVRRAFNDPAGFATGWVLLLDYLIVSALAALFVPHYLAALGLEQLRDSPWDVVVGVAVVLALSAVRLVRRPQLYRLAVVVAVVAVVSHVLLIVLGFALLFDADAFRGIDLGADPAWDELAFALPLAMLAYTGLETVANLSAETKEPGRTLPAEPLRGDRRRRRRLGRGRRRRDLGLPGRERDARHSASAGGWRRSRESRTRSPRSFRGCSATSSWESLL